MADPSILEAVKLAGSGILGGALVSFAKNFFTDAGKDAREFRQEYRDEIKRLREDRAKDQDEIEELREDVRVLRTGLEDQQIEHAKQMHVLREQIRVLTDFQVHLIVSRAEARADLNALQRTQGEPLTIWLPDPSPTGGTP